MGRPGRLGRRRSTSSAYERTFLGIAITVVVVWTIATLVQVAFPNHVVPVSVNVVMGTVATAFFGGALLSSRRAAEADMETQIEMDRGRRVEELQREARDKKEET